MPFQGAWIRLLNPASVMWRSTELEHAVGNTAVLNGYIGSIRAHACTAPRLSWVDLVPMHAGC
eukprot:945910-Amphidinium_carterae.3